MSSIEFTAKSLEEAKATAAAKLGVDADKVTVTVLEETKGLFGKMNLKIRAEAEDASPEAEAPAEKPVKGKKAVAAKPEKADKPAKTEKPTEETPAPEKPVKAAKGRGKKVEAPAEADSETSEPAAEVEEVQASEEDATRILGFAQQIVDASGLQAEVAISDRQGKYVSISIDGEEAGYFVGKSGEVLNQFQYLLNVISAQQLRNGVRVTLDGNHYRTKREEQLTILANKIAEEVVKRQEEAMLEALPAFERRIIHKALAENKSVITFSEGEEPDRAVIIAPAD